MTDSDRRKWHSSLEAVRTLNWIDLEDKVYRKMRVVACYGKNHEISGFPIKDTDLKELMKKDNDKIKEHPLVKKMLTDFHDYEEFLENLRKEGISDDKYEAGKIEANKTFKFSSRMWCAEKKILARSKFKHFTSPIYVTKKPCISCFLFFHKLVMNPKEIKIIYKNEKQDKFDDLFVETWIKEAPQDFAANMPAMRSFIWKNSQLADTKNQNQKSIFDACEKVRLSFEKNQSSVQ